MKQAICLVAPETQNVDLFCDFIKDKLAGKVDALVLLIRYNFRFKSHPECAEENSLTVEQAKQIKKVCDDNNILLVPKMNLMGHQSDHREEYSPFNTTAAYMPLLKAYPQYDETPEKEITRYCRSICPTAPGIKELIFDLMDDMVEAFDAKNMHIGCDEVFEIGTCERCKDIPNYKIFADWVTALHDHLKEKGVTTWMWGDRLLKTEENNNHVWEAAENDTDKAIDLIPTDIVICDWHYEEFETYPSAKLFSSRGFKTVPSYFKSVEAKEKFLSYYKENAGDSELYEMFTTWVPFEMLYDAYTGKDKDNRAQVLLPNLESLIGKY